MGNTQQYESRAKNNNDAGVVVVEIIYRELRNNVRRRAKTHSTRDFSFQLFGHSSLTHSHTKTEKKDHLFQYEKSYGIEIVVIRQKV